MIEFDDVAVRYPRATVPAIAGVTLEARRRLVESGVLDRFEDKHGPSVLEEANGQ